MHTKLIRSLHNIQAHHQNGVITIGNFDGVHLGHQQLIKKVVERARKLNVPSIVIAFEPHPAEFFAGNKVAIPRLTRLREKFSYIKHCGVDYVLILPFNQYLATLSASDFVIQVLYKKLRPTEMIIGDDFQFGHKRLGNFELLQKMGQALGFKVEAMNTLLVEGERVSSTRVRKALGMGDHKLTETLLGHPYRMQGRVRGGDQLGRQLGFPTANIFLHRKLTPVHGIYIVYMRGLSDHPLPGVANVGTRPTVNGTRTLLEVHLLDFDENIYGRYVEVEFCEKLREEERYPDLEQLKQQIQKDVLDARDYFKKHGVL